MILGILAGLTLLMLLVGIILFIIGVPKGPGKANNGESQANDAVCAGVVLCSLAVIAAIITGAAFSGVYASKVGDLGRREAFYNASIENFEVTYTESKALLSTEEFRDVLIAGDLEKMRLGDAVVGSLTDLREAANEFNKWLGHTRAMRSSWVYPGVLIYPNVSHLNLLVIQP